MENTIRKFLEFNGKVIYFLGKEGQYWIAIKPICEALGIDFSRQLRTLKADSILARAWSKQTIHDRSGRLQKIVCISEKFVYGWIFSLRSDSKQLQDYKLKCYELLFDYFHGIITGRKELLAEKAKAQIEREQLIAELKQIPQYQRLQELAAADKHIASELKAFDKGLYNEQLSLFR